MTDANEEASETIIAELNVLFICDAGESEEEQKTFSSSLQASDDIPPSLISYFENSKSRAVVCEKLILEEYEDFPISYEDLMNLAFEFDGDMMKLNEQINIETENEDTSTDTHLLCAPTETDLLFPPYVAVCSHNEDEGETDEDMESARHLAFKVGIPKTPVKQADIKESSKHREKWHAEEMGKEEQIVQREKDFQEELKKLIEAEKLNQMELQLMEKRAQERLEHELLLQKELISNLQKRVEEERRMREEEMKRIKEEEEKKKKVKEERRRREEEDRRKRHDEKIKREMQSIEEEMRRTKEEVEKRRIEEVKAEEERRNNEEEQLKKKKTEEEKRRVEKDEKRNKVDQKTKIEEEMRKEGEERKLDGSEEEEKRKLMEEEETLKRGKEKERREVSMRKEKEENTLKRRKEEISITNECEARMYQQDMRTKREEQRKTEEENRKAVIEKIKGEQMRKEEENRKIEDVMQPKVYTDVEWRHGVENNTVREKNETIKEEELRKRLEEEIERKKGDEYTKMEDVRLKEGIKTHEAGNRNVEQERKLKDKKGGQDDIRKRHDGGINTEADKGHIRKEGAENKEESIKLEARRLKEEENKIIIAQDTEKESRLTRPTDLQQENQENSLISQDERKNTDSTGHLLTSQLEDSTTWLSSGSGPLRCTFTANSSSCETIQLHDPDSNAGKTMDQPDVGVQTCSSSGSLLLHLPERTEQKRLSWMKDCIPWSKLSLQNRGKHKGSVRSGRLPRRPAESSSLPPLCSDALLQTTGFGSLQEVTAVTLEDLPGCNLSTLLQCTQLRSLTLRRCGLKSLEGISQLPELCYINVEQNDISFVDCENMTSLRVLLLGHNKLTSIHGLSGADNLDVLELSHNSISRIAGLESMRRLQRLSVDHNQLISTKGLRDIYTLLHLNCSYNHLASVEGLENSPLLNTLDLRGNSLTEPPSLTNHVLLRELHLDDNSISSLQSLSACWLPLMQHLSVAQNRITQLSSMSDFISLENLDLRFNCMSELQNVCENLEGCQFLQGIHLTGNPLQQESDWRSSLQKALPGLRAIDDQDTDSFLSPPAVQQISLASVSFLSFCQAQIQQINDLQRRHSRELSNASSPLDAIKSSCQHFSETLKLAEDQRFAHEYGDIAMAAGQTVLKKTADMESTNAKMFTEHLPLESTDKAPSVIKCRNYIRCSCCTFEEKSSTESWHHTLDTVTTLPKTDLQSSATKGKTFSFHCKIPALCNHQDLAHKNTAAGVIQQQWRKYRQKCASISGPPLNEKQGGRGGDGENPQSGPFCITKNSVDPHYAATVIQAFWRGWVVRRRLLSALAAVTSPSTAEDDTFEEMDVDEFVFDEAALEKLWTLQLSDDSPSIHDSVSEEPPSLKVSGPFPEPFQYTLPPPPLWKPTQAWVAGKQVDSAGLRVSPESSSRKSPASTSVLGGISERSEKILEEWGFTDSHTALLMLKRAQKMKSNQQQKNKLSDPSVHLALFRNCHYQLGPVEARNRPASQGRNLMKVCKTKLSLQQCEKTEQVKQEQAQQWLHTQSDRDSESEHFLPEISPDILNGGRVQLVADPAYTERHHASGSCANSSSAAHPRKLNNYAHRISLGHARKDVPSPKRVTSAPSKKERISFRDNPVQLSGGWGGGKKRDKVYK